MRSAAIVLAAGAGSRMRMGKANRKQFMKVKGKPLICYCLETFEKSFIDEVILVVPPGEKDRVQKSIVDRYGFAKVRKIIEGGKERYHSVALGLHAITLADVVFIHDGARPFVTQDMLQRCMQTMDDTYACVTAMPAKNTIKIADDEEYACMTPDRTKVWEVQTPQVFKYSLIRSVYDRMLQEEPTLLRQGVHITDDAMLVERYTDIKVKLVKGSYRNIKITTPEDLPVAEGILKIG